jgi:UDP-N-acetylmuramoyl-L-alanyl-D-glutamate--2,6-diaminopimelate ligase
MSATLTAIADAAGGVVVAEGGDTSISDVTHDSRDVSPGSLFVAIRGERFDGHDFIETALAAGASALAVEAPVSAAGPQLVVADTRGAMAYMASVVHGRPDRTLSIIGVTGTNGKTTVTHLCEAAWNAEGRSNGMIGTLGARFDGTPVELGHTTPESSDLQRLLGRMRDDRIRSVAMEVSSHALELHRADAIRFTAVGFTNLTQDHLDFHGTMEAYFASKLQLFQPERAGVAVINIDDTAGARLARTTTLPVVTTGLIDSADIRASDLVMTPSGTRFTLVSDQESATVELPLIGDFNVENALVAAGLLIADGVELVTIARGFAAMRPITGRMEIVQHNGPFTVVVDYAHTPDAVSAVLASTRDFSEGRVTVVIGAGGDRDQDKRSLMGAAAARFSDVTIVTTDNPRSEDPAVIAAEVGRGAETDGRSEVFTILDRREAIIAAIEGATNGDVVMILGKGHEQGQEINGTTIPFDDRAVAVDALEIRGDR